MKVLVYGQRAEGKDAPFVKELMGTLHALGAEIVFYSPFYAQLTSLGFLLDAYKHMETYEDLVLYKPDFVITMGGDGTILKATTLVKDSGIPILGINLGRLGFLASIEKSNINEIITEIQKGNYFVDERSLIALKSNIEIFGDTRFALNDFTITKRDTSSMIIIKAYIDGQLLNAYWADGLIVATPTGSTGYSLSCGGPILFPDSHNFVLTPIAPHNLNVRPIVIPDDNHISFEIEGRAENYLCTLDSRFETITSDHKIEISKSPFTIKLAHPVGSDFKKTISNKLMWGLDMRN